MEFIYDIFFDYTIRNVALGSSILGIVAGAFGSFAFLRRESLAGDVVAHSALPGIVLAFLLSFFITGSSIKNPLILIFGATITGFLAMHFSSRLMNISKIKSDSSMGIMLAVFFGLGIFLLSLIQRRNIPGKSGLQDYIFGSASTLTHDDVNIIIIFGALTLLNLFVFWKEFKLHTFDRTYAHSLGFNSKLLDAMMVSSIVIAIIIGLQSVGVILMVAMIVTPAAAARQWTNKLAMMVVISAFIGLIAGLSGALISASVQKLPTGPVIVLILVLIFVISILFSPNRGLIAELIKNIARKQRIRLSLVLVDLYQLKRHHNDDYRVGHSAKVLLTMHEQKFNVRKSLIILSELGLVRNMNGDVWVLTDKGLKKAESILQTKGELI
jgi:manganese/zinc/iron transport system permease protein